jgi:hypothetical protein
VVKALESVIIVIVVLLTFLCKLFVDLVWCFGWKFSTHLPSLQHDVIYVCSSVPSTSTFTATATSTSKKSFVYAYNGSRPHFRLHLDSS